MIQTQIQFTEGQASALKEIAQQHGVSMAELIRRAVERIVEENDKEDTWRRASALIGRYHIRNLLHHRTCVPVPAAGCACESDTFT